MNHLILDVNYSAGGEVIKLINELNIKKVTGINFEDDKAEQVPKGYESFFMYFGTLTNSDAERAYLNNIQIFRKMIPYVQKLNTLTVVILVLNIDVNSGKLSNNDKFLLDNLVKHFGINALENLGIIYLCQNPGNNPPVEEKTQSITQYLKEKHDIVLFKKVYMVSYDIRELAQRMQNESIEQDTYDKHSSEIKKQLKAFYQNLIDEQMPGFKTKYAGVQSFDLASYNEDERDVFEGQKAQLEREHKKVINKEEEKRNKVQNDAFAKKRELDKVTEEINKCNDKIEQLQQQTQRSNKIQDKIRANDEEIEQLEDNLNALYSKYEKQQNELLKQLDSLEQEEYELRAKRLELERATNIAENGAENTKTTVSAYYYNVFMPMLSKCYDYIHKSRNQRSMQWLVLNSICNYVENLFNSQKANETNQEQTLELMARAVLLARGVKQSKAKFPEEMFEQIQDRIDNICHSFIEEEEVQTPQQLSRFVTLATYVPFTQINIDLTTNNGKKVQKRNVIQQAQLSVFNVIFNSSKESVIRFNFSTQEKLNDNTLKLLIYREQIGDSYQIKCEENYPINDAQNNAMNEFWKNVDHMIVVCGNKTKLQFLKYLNLKSLAVYNIESKQEKKEFTLDNVDNLHTLILQNALLVNLDKCKSLTNLSSSGSIYAHEGVDNLTNIEIFTSENDVFKRNVNPMIRKLAVLNNRLSYVSVRGGTDVELKPKSPDSPLQVIQFSENATKYLQYIHLEQSGVELQIKVNQKLPKIIVFAPGKATIATIQNNKCRSVKALVSGLDYRVEQELILLLHNTNLNVEKLKQDKQQKDESDDEIMDESMCNSEFQESRSGRNSRMNISTLNTSNMQNKSTISQNEGENEIEMILAKFDGFFRQKSGEMKPRSGVDEAELREALTEAMEALGVARAAGGGDGSGSGARAGRGARRGRGNA